MTCSRVLALIVKGITRPRGSNRVATFFKKFLFVNWRSIGEDLFPNINTSTQTSLGPVEIFLANFFHHVGRGAEPFLGMHTGFCQGLSQMMIQPIETLLINCRVHWVIQVCTFKDSFHYGLRLALVPSNVLLNSVLSSKQCRLFFCQRWLIQIRRPKAFLSYPRLSTKNGSNDDQGELFIFSGTFG